LEATMTKSYLVTDKRLSNLMASVWVIGIVVVLAIALTST
jgi:hypothetical protein